MAEPRHRPPGDRSFLASLGRHVGAAAALMVVMAGVFWAIGQVDGDDQLVVADGPDGATPSATDPATATPSEDAADVPSMSPTGTPTQPGTPTAEDGGTPTESPTDSPPPTEDAAAIPPSEISIQVLDAVRLEGSTAAQELADELEADGYDVVVVQQASKVYDVTTVFYTAGFEDSARQLAAAYGFTRVEEKPDNLSDTVRVHLVVGRDRA